MEGFEIENMDLIKVDVETLTLRDKVDTVFMVNIYNFFFFSFIYYKKKKNRKFFIPLMKQ